jgi:hypothetical protein
MADNDFTRRVHARQEPLTDISAGEMYDLAFEYWQRGFSVVPLKSEAKNPAIGWKYYQDNAPTRGCIDAWWLEQFLGAGIAVVLGPISNLFAIDVDGAEAHRALVEHLGGLPIAPQVQSGSGDPHRFHLYFRYPTGGETKAKATPWHDELEFRGYGGITVLPPSLHKSGNRYQWVPGRSLYDLDPPELPNAVLTALEEAHQPRQSRRSERRHQPQPGGRRQRLANFPGICPKTQQFLDGVYSQGPNWNDRLFLAACDMAGCRISLDKSVSALMVGADPSTPEDRANALATIHSAFSRERQSARQLAAEADDSVGHSRASIEFTIGNTHFKFNR